MKSRYIKRMFIDLGYGAIEVYKLKQEMREARMKFLLKIFKPIMNYLHIKEEDIYLIAIVFMIFLNSFIVIHWSEMVLK